jgi:hypothetical protein
MRPKHVAYTPMCIYFNNFNDILNINENLVN